MDYKVRLLRDNGFKWHFENGVHIKGYIYLNGIYIDNSEVVSFLAGAAGKDDFIDRVLRLNGCFSIVAELNSGVIAVSDTIRSFPLFYSKKDNVMYISDEAEELIKQTGYKEINKEGLIDYLHSCCVYFNETLIMGINQVSSMSYMFFDKQMGNTEYKKYKTIYNSEYSITTETKMKESLDGLFNGTSKRLVDSLKGRTAAVALSGGVDSRACLMMLHMAGYKDVICFTYGCKNSPEEYPARKVAAKLGYKYVFVPHKRKDWRRTYKDEESLEYIRYSGNMSSIAHMEAHYVFRQLIKEKIIPKDSVVITGHIGLVASSKFNIGSLYKKEEIMEMFWNYWTKLYPYRGRRKTFYQKRFSGYFPVDEEYTCRNAEIIYENASFDTVRSKHIINYHRLFEMYGFEWRMPLMDFELMSGFEKIQPGVREKTKKVFSEYVLDYTGHDIKPAQFSLSFAAKAYRNIKNPMYGIITPWRFLFSGCRKTLLPPFPIRQYRFLRRFYSYCALQEFKLIKKWISEI